VTGEGGIKVRLTGCGVFLQTDCIVLGFQILFPVRVNDAPEAGFDIIPDVGRA
jgi:hypothetical protein